MSRNTKTTPADAVLLTVGETAVTLRIGESLTRKLIQDGKIPSLKLGRRLLVPRAELLRAVREWHKQGAESGGAALQQNYNSVNDTQYHAVSRSNTKRRVAPLESAK